MTTREGLVPSVSQRTAPTAADVAGRLDGLTRWSLPYLAIAIIGVGFLFTFYDIFDINVSFIQTCIALKPGCTPATALGVLKVPVVLNLAGYVVGTLVLSPMCDRIGLENLGSEAHERSPRGLVLLAEVNGVPWAAVSLDDSHAVSAPWPGASDLLFDLLGVARARRRAARAQNPRVWPAQPELPIAPGAARTTRTRPERSE